MKPAIVKMSGFKFSDPDFYDQLFDFSITDHGGMNVFGEEDGELTGLQLKEGMWCVVIELHIFLFLEISIGLMALAAWSPTDCFSSADAKLDVYITVMAFKLRGAGFGGFTWCGADDGLQSICNVRLTICRGSEVGSGDPGEGTRQQGMQRRISGSVCHRVYDHIYLFTVIRER
jgi:hypothetical protein